MTALQLLALANALFWTLWYAPAMYRSDMRIGPLQCAIWAVSLVIVMASFAGLDGWA